jgi:hypothetical protein
MALLGASCWSTGRLVSREEYCFAPFLIGPLTGAAIGAIYGKFRGAFAGVLVGFLIALLSLVADVLFWLVFTLPPHPKIDL